MTNGTRTRARWGIGLLVATVAAAATVVAPSPARAADGAQTPPTLVPAPVATESTGFSFGVGTGAFCDGTGADGWRAHTFIVNDGVALGTLTFTEAFPFGAVGEDFDATDGTIRAPLYHGSTAGDIFNPASSPEGLIDPDDLSGFDFTLENWNLVDGDYQIGFACEDGANDIRQWWSITVTIDADASPNPFMVVATDEPDPQDTTVVVTADPASATVGASVTFTASVSPPAAAGNVEFFVDGTSQSTAAVAGGTATWTTSALTVGTKSITAAFTPSDSGVFGASTSSPLSFTVSGADAVATSVVLTAAPADEATEGEDVTLTATVTPSSATGNVSFSADGFTLASPVDLASGVATLTTNDLEVGELELVASFTPADPNAFTGSTGTLDYTVASADGAETTVTLSTNPVSTAAFGSAVTVTATVSPSGAAGVVKFTRTTENAATVGLANDQGVALADGKASVTISDLPVGQHQLRAEFVSSDADAFQSSTSLALSFTVTEAASGTTTTTSTTATTTTPAQVQGQSTGSSSPLPFTGTGLVPAGVGLLLIYLGRVAYLLARPHDVVARR